MDYDGRLRLPHVCFTLRFLIPVICDFHFFCFIARKCSLLLMLPDSVGVTCYHFRKYIAFLSSSD